MKVQIGDKIVEADSSGVVEAKVERVEHPDGRVDVIIHVPCLQIAAKKAEV